MHYPILASAFGAPVAIYATDRAVVLRYDDAPFRQPAAVARITHHQDRIDLTLETGQRCTAVPRVFARSHVRAVLAGIRRDHEGYRISRLAPLVVSMFRQRASRA